MKTFKTIYLITIITITVCVVGLFGARRFGRLSGLFGSPDIVKDSVKTEPFQEIQLEADVADFKIIEGDEYRVDYSYPSNITVTGKVENGVLKVNVRGKVNKNGNNFLRINGKGIQTVDTKLTIVVPEGSDLSKIDLSVDAGNIELKDRVFDDVVIASAACNVELYKITSDKVKITADTGKILVEKSTSKDAEFTLSAGALEVNDSTFDTVDVTGSLGSIRFDESDFTKGDIESSLGEVIVDGNFEDLTIKTSLGQIRVDSENIEKAKLNLSMDMGEIEVNGDKKGGEYKQN
jgi:DUF4097 and DUF4098 domain-containing protein YvlB